MPKNSPHVRPAGCSAGGGLGTLAGSSTLHGASGLFPEGCCSPAATQQTVCCAEELGND